MGPPGQKVILAVVHASAARSAKYEARGKYGEHEVCRRVTGGVTRATLSSWIWFIWHRWVWIIVSVSSISLKKTTAYKFGKKGKHNRGSSEPMEHRWWIMNFFKKRFNFWRCCNSEDNEHFYHNQRFFFFFKGERGVTGLIGFPGMTGAPGPIGLPGMVSFSANET